MRYEHVLVPANKSRAVSLDWFLSLAFLAVTDSYIERNRVSFAQYNYLIRRHPHKRSIHNVSDFSQGLRVRDSKSH